MPATIAVPGSTDGEPLRPTPVAGRSSTPDGVRVAYYDLGGTGPDLLLVHATGFCGATLGPLAARLGTRYHCWALDERGHGGSGRPPHGDYDWHGFAADVLSVIDTLGLKRPLGVGHSCGGAALLLAEEERPGTFAGIYCFEPIVFPGEDASGQSQALDGNPLSVGAMRRRTRFASRHEALANFSGKAPFDRLHPDALAAYVDNGFAPDDEGGITLRCRREDEAKVYALSFAHGAFSRFHLVRCPVALACGEHTDAVGPKLLGLLAARLPRAGVEIVPGVGHFGPLEDPGAVAASVMASLPRSS